MFRIWRQPRRMSIGSRANQSIKFVQLQLIQLRCCRWSTTPKAMRLKSFPKQPCVIDQLLVCVSSSMISRLKGKIKTTISCSNSEKAKCVVDRCSVVSIDFPRALPHRTYTFPAKCDYTSSVKTIYNTHRIAYVSSAISLLPTFLPAALTIKTQKRLFWPRYLPWQSRGQFYKKPETTSGL